MVILVVCLWHEPDSQLLAWAWHWGHKDRWQPNAFYCLPLPLVRITSVMNTARMTWISLSLSTVCVSVCMYAWMEQMFACLCAFVLYSVILPRYVLTQRRELQVALGVWEQFTSCWCLSVRYTQPHTGMHTQAHNCIFVHSIPYTCVRVYIQSCTSICSDMSTHGLRCTNACLCIRVQQRTTHDAVSYSLVPPRGHIECICKGLCIFFINCVLGKHVIIYRFIRYIQINYRVILITFC